MPDFVPSVIQLTFAEALHDVLAVTDALPLPPDEAYESDDLPSVSDTAR